MLKVALRRIAGGAVLAVCTYKISRCEHVANNVYKPLTGFGRTVSPFVAPGWDVKVLACA